MGEYIDQSLHRLFNQRELIRSNILQHHVHVLFKPPYWCTCDRLRGTVKGLEALMVFIKDIYIFLFSFTIKQTCSLTEIVPYILTLFRVLFTLKQVKSKQGILFWFSNSEYCYWYIIFVKWWDCYVLKHFWGY